MRFTRPDLPKLNIDLAELRATDTSPARFEGITSEGREIEGKYRNGCLHIYYSDTDEVLLEATIGDSIDMTMLPEQLCDLAGFTILGKQPTLSSERFEAARKDFLLRDWSGATTYWSFDLVYTLSAGFAFLSDFQKSFPGTFVNYQYLSEDRPAGWVVQRLTDGMDLWGSLYLGVQPDDAIVAQHLAGEFVDHFDPSRIIGCHLPISIQSRDYNAYDSTLASKNCGRAVHVHPTFHGRIGGEIKTGSETELRRLEAIEAFVARPFFNTIKGIDIDTGEVVERLESRNWSSRDLADWCDASRKRFLSATAREDETRPMGYLMGLLGVTAREIEKRPIGYLPDLPDA